LFRGGPPPGGGVGGGATPRRVGPSPLAGRSPREARRVGTMNNHNPQGSPTSAPSPALVQSPFVPRRPSLVKGVVLEPLPNGVYRVELENGAKVLAHVADRAGTHFTRLLAGDKVGVELAETDRSRGRIREIWR
jgi:translation initiation factor IF-1